MNPELDRLANTIDDQIAELRVWGEGLSTVSALLEFQSEARGLARALDDLADEAIERAEQLAEN